MKKLTHIEKTRRELAAVKLQVQNLLGWTDEQYATFQYETGVAYIRRMSDLPLHDALLESILAQKELWSWWRLHWMRRDRHFMEMSSVLFKHEYEAYYRDEVHNLTEASMRPHRRIMETSYSDMMHRIIKETVK